MCLILNEIHMRWIELVIVALNDIWHITTVREQWTSLKHGVQYRKSVYAPNNKLQFVGLNALENPVKKVQSGAVFRLAFETWYCSSPCQLSFWCYQWDLYLNPVTLCDTIIYRKPLPDTTLTAVCQQHSDSPLYWGLLTWNSV